MLWPRTLRTGTADPGSSWRPLVLEPLLLFPPFSWANAPSKPSTQASHKPGGTCVFGVSPLVRHWWNVFPENKGAGLGALLVKSKA